MTQIHIAAKALKAAVVLAAKQDIRRYLNGVFIQAWANETRLVATDGHALGVIRDEQSNQLPDDAPLVEFILPRGAIEGLKLSAREIQTQTLRIEISPDGAHRLIHGGLAQTFTPVEGRFPDYRRVIPTKTTGLVSHFDPELIARMGKCLGILNPARRDGVVSMRVEHNGEVAENGKRCDGGALVYGAHNNFVGVMMPLRTFPDDMGAEWARNAPEPELVEA